MEQLKSGVADGFLSAAAARRMLLEQPEFLVRRWSTIYEDERILVLDKPCDVRMSLPKGEHWQGEESVQGWCSSNHPSTLTDGGDARLCHNLDFVTSGILVAAKSARSADDVSKAFRERSCKKLYAALVFGHPDWLSASAPHVMDARIQPSQKRFRQRISPGGKKAHTEAVVAARGRLRVGPHRGKQASLLWVMPETGRRHQIRLHLSHAGFPIVGDYTYAADAGCYRTFLHAGGLRLPMPILSSGGDSAGREQQEVLNLLSPVSPSAWANVFYPEEPFASPERWPQAAEQLLAESSDGAVE
jgi:23S rRNA-/tRNA-specific pseudouridylate synthase